MTKQEVKPHTIRFPPELYKAIKEIARKEDRTFNAQVIHLLKQGLLTISTISEIYGVWYK